MCGIFGICSPYLPENRIIKAALDTLRHRGPDDEGYFFGDTRTDNHLRASGVDSAAEIRKRYQDIGDPDLKAYDLLLANRRLSILDLTVSGHQPFGNAKGDLWITHNGEIFNYQELRSELKTHGYPFRSNTDTEVILAAYEYWGEDCLHRFNGQWAFCIYDQKKRTLFCSRDRFGIKPFYYWHADGRFVFSSQTDAFFKLPFIPAHLANHILADFLLHSRLEHRHETVYENIYQLLPGHNLHFDLSSRKLKTRAYYAPRRNKSLGSYSHSQALRYADDIRTLLIDAVKVRLVSDVPVGSCLSGGLDSTAIVAIINLLIKDGSVSAGAIRDRQKTFTACFDDPAVDEKRLAEALIRQTGAQGFFSYPRAGRLWQDLDRFLQFQGGLCFGTNIYAGWVVMQQAASHVKVLLNGQGSDELFGGYDRYNKVLFSEILRNSRIVDFIKLFRKKARMYGTGSVLKTVLRAGYGMVEPKKLKQLRWRLQRNATLGIIKQMLGQDVFFDLSPDFGNLRKASLNDALCSDQTSSYLPMLLRYDDHNAASVSIENRVPFLDHRLVAYVNAIPSIYKMYNGWSKWLLRLAMQDLLPDQITWKKNKNGFATPYRKWIAHRDSPTPALMGQYNIRHTNTFLWRLLLAEKLVAAQAGNHGASGKGD